VLKERVPAPLRRLARPLRRVLPRSAGGAPRVRRDFESTWNERPLEYYLDPDWHERAHFKRSQELIVDFVARLATTRSAPLTLLDAPCGNGRFYRGLESAGLLGKVEYTGVDLTPKLVEASRRLMPGVAIVEGSVEALPFADGSFEVVVAQHIIRHLETFEQAVREFLRVSRSFVIVAEKGAALPGAPDIRDAYWSEADKSHYWAISWEPNHLKQFARENGAALAFTLNDARHDDPDGQYVYVFCR
jgi:SAM-dependent methyltransferase